MAIEGILALIRDQVMGKQPRPTRSKTSAGEGFAMLLEQDASVVHQICLELDVASICRLQCVCKQLFQELSSNGLWCLLCERRQIRLSSTGPTSAPSIDWKHVFACFASLQVRRFGWTFQHPEELIRVAEQVRKLGPQRTDALTVLRRHIPATAFWQWWFVTTRRSTGGGNGVKAKPTSKPRRRLVLRTSTRSITRGMPDLPPLASQPSAASSSTSSRRQSPRGGSLVPRAPVVLTKPQPRPSRAAAPVPQHALSPAKMPPRLPPRPGGSPARPPSCCQYSPFDYSSKQQLQMHLRALVAEASNSGVRVQQLRNLLRQLMKVRIVTSVHSSQPDRVLRDRARASHIVCDCCLQHQKNPHDLFNVPVDAVALGIPDYDRVIANKMDLGTVKRRLEGGKYQSTTEYAEDVRLVFDNAQTFNPLGHWINSAAAHLSAFFEEKLRRLEGKVLTERQRQAGHSCKQCHGLTCRGCGEGCLHFTPSALRCMGPCNMMIRRGSLYHQHKVNDIQLCPRCFKRLSGTGNRLSASPGGLKVEDGESDEEEDSERAMAEIDKSTVAARNRQKIVAVKDPELYTEERWDPDWGEPEPWVQCVCCLEVYHQVCGMYDPKADDPNFVCSFCRLKHRGEPTDVLANGPEPSPTELGALRVDHSRAVPKASSAKSGVTRSRGRGKGVQIETKSGSGQSSASRTSARAQEAEKGKTPYSVPVPGTPALPWPVPSPPTSERYDAWSLPQTKLGQFIEERIKTELIDLGERDAAAAVVVRVVSSRDEATGVKSNVRAGYSAHGAGAYAEKYCFSSKAIFLFQRLDGLDVLLFVMYVQEYDASCPSPNRRQVYISYLDSVQYFRPRRLRTTVYQTLIASYMEFARRRGFTGAHIWACPPLRSGSYIFCSRPVEQQVPTGQRLRAWYQEMLHLCHRHGTVVGSTTMYDRYFGNMGDVSGNRRRSKSKQAKTSGHRKSAGSAHRASDPVPEFRWSHGLPPWFEGDWWTLQADTVIKSARWQQPKRILRQLMEHPLNRLGLFNTPVDPVAMGIPEYRQVIQQPMDLSTIRGKLDRSQYQTPATFADDVRLVFNNAMTFNSAGHYVHSVGKQLLAFFEERLAGYCGNGSTTVGQNSKVGGTNSASNGITAAARANTIKKGSAVAPSSAGSRKRKESPCDNAATVLHDARGSGIVAEPPADTPPAVWHSLLQNTATFLLGTRDEHIVAFMHWHCSVCSRAIVDGTAMVSPLPVVTAGQTANLDGVGTSCAASSSSCGTGVQAGSTDSSGGLKRMMSKDRLFIGPNLAPCRALCADCYAANPNALAASEGLHAGDLEPVAIVPAGSTQHSQMIDVDSSGRGRLPDGTPAVLLNDTSDPDDNSVPNRFVDTRSVFFDECSEGNYNFDTLRRAKHSSMMVLHRLHGLHGDREGGAIDPKED
eukprot:SAG31_NODE_752_length_12351_cov_14.467516_6_plen_1414_part_00